MSQFFVGVDNGGTVTKAAVFDRFGRMVGVASRAGILSTPQPGFTERDMERLWLDTAAVIREAVSGAGISPESVAGLACTGHGKGLYLWGRDNRPARPGIISTDTRADEYIRRWEQDGTAAAAYEKTLQSVLVSQPCALLAWIKDQEPGVYANIQWIFEVKDYIRFRLTGQALAEKTDYSGTNLMNLRTRTFDRSLLELFGIPEVEGCLPPLAEATQICGRITPEAAALTGLVPGTPVAGGMFDIDACALATGVIDERCLCMIAGTWSINEYVARQPVENRGVAMNSLFCLPGFYLAEESSPTSAGNLEWFVNTLLSCDRSQAEREGGSIYAELDRMVEQTPLDENGPLFLPYLYGAPELAQASAGLYGLQAHHKKADIVRAVFEGIVFSHKEHTEKLLACRDRPECVRLSGGAANSKAWVQMFADVLGLPVETVPVKEPGALGCAIAAAAAVGAYSDCAAAVKNMVHESVRVEPSEQAYQAYRRKYARFLALKKALYPLWTAPRGDSSK